MLKIWLAVFSVVVLVALANAVQACTPPNITDHAEIRALMQKERLGDLTKQEKGSLQRYQKAKEEYKNFWLRYYPCPMSPTKPLSAEEKEMMRELQREWGFE